MFGDEAIAGEMTGTAASRTRINSSGSRGACSSGPRPRSGEPARTRWSVMRRRNKTEP